MSKEYPDLTKALDLHADSDSPIVDLIDHETSINSLVDGLMSAVLEIVSMAQMVTTTQNLNGTGGIDNVKVQRGRVKMVEGLLEIIAAGETGQFIDDQIDLAENGSLSTLGVLKDFVARTNSKLAEIDANEQPE